MMYNILKRYWSTQIAFVIGTWIVAVGIVGMFDLFDMSFNFDRLKSPAYWSEVFTLVTAGILIFATTLFNYFLELKQEDAQSTKQEEHLYNKFNLVNTADLPEFVNEENTERRITAYKEKISAEFENLLTKVTLRRPESLDIWVSKDEEAKENDPWCIKLQRQKELLDEDYIEANKFNLPVKFQKITPNFIQNGVNKSNGQTSLENPSSSVSTAAKDNVFNFLLPILTTSVILTLALTFMSGRVWMVIFMTLVKVFALLIQHWSAKMYAPSFYKKTRVYDLGLRYRLGQKYFQWKINKKKIKEEDEYGSRKRQTEDNVTERLQPRPDTTSAEPQR